jgi:hypothetical protein
MKRNTLQARLIAIALLALGASTAQAQGWGSEIRQDNREIRKDRQELRSDYRELERDRADYARARANGDVAGMYRERREIRQDVAEINRDRAKLRHDLRERRQDMSDHRNHGSDYRRAGWNQERLGSWNRTSQEHPAAIQHRSEARHDRAVQPASWQGTRPTSSTPSTNTSQGNNGRHAGWSSGRGNPKGS